MKNSRCGNGVKIRPAILKSVVCFFVGLLIVLQNCNAEILVKSDPSNTPISIVVRAAQNPIEIKPEVSGTNIMSVKDGDFRSDFAVSTLKRMGIKTLRFPGGTLSQNYDWKQNKFSRQDVFPFEAKSQLNYLDFLSSAHEMGASTIFFVVNLGGAFLEPGDLQANINKYADDAADWVTAVKKAGYFVPYWEIGNEAYLRSSYPLTADEYANALKIFYKKMKAADARIMIGAVGPNTLTGEQSVGFADRLGEKGLSQLREKILVEKDMSVCENENRKSCLRDLGQKPKKNSDEIIWWAEVANRASGSFDFAIIHRYGKAGDEEDKSTRDVSLQQQIQNLKKYLEGKASHSVTLALTEWNTPTKSPMPEMLHAMEIAEQMGLYLSGGVDYALYWPLSLQDRSPLMRFDDSEPLPASDVYQLFSEFHQKNICDTNYDAQQDIYVFCTQNEKSKSIMIINKSHSDRRATLIADKKISGIQKSKYMAEKQNGAIEIDQPVSIVNPDQSGEIIFKLLPRSINWIEIE